MKVEYDPEKAETVLHLDSNEMGTILFALDLTSTVSISAKSRKEALDLRKEIKKGM